MPISIEGVVDDGIRRLESHRSVILQSEMERVGADLNLSQFNQFPIIKARIWNLGWLLSVMADSCSRKMEVMN